MIGILGIVVVVVIVFRRGCRSLSWTLLIG
jgi:hypothetical protein